MTLQELQLIKSLIQDSVMLESSNKMNAMFILNREISLRTTDYRSGKPLSAPDYIQDPISTGKKDDKKG